MFIFLEIHSSSTPNPGLIIIGVVFITQTADISLITMNSSYLMNLSPKFNAILNGNFSDIPDAIHICRQYARALSREVSFTIFDHKMLHDERNWCILSELLIMTTALTIIIIGSYATIEKPMNALEPNPAHPLFDQSDKDKTSNNLESIDTPNAIFMPFLSCIGLLSLYFLLKKIDAATLSNFINAFFLIISNTSFSYTFKFLYKVACRKMAHWTGISSLTFNPRYCLCLSKDTKIHSNGIELETILPESTERERVIKEDALLRVRDDIRPKDQIWNQYFTRGDLYCSFVGMTLNASFALLDYGKIWFLSNTAASLTSIYGIFRLRITSFRTATLILVMFCIYDIYFVFGTSVMESVALNINVPAKLVFPRYASRKTDVIATSMLGLGDIVLPGVVIALCLRYDLYNFHASHKLTEFHHLQKYSKPYFFASLVSYIIAIIMAMAASQIYQAGQPALLYVSPMVLFGIYTTAILKHQVSDLWKYEENMERDEYGNKAIDIDVLCSKETLQLVAELESDQDSDEDPDYIPDSEGNEAEDWESDE